MRRVVIVVASALALASTACSRPGERASQGRASNSGNTATSTGGDDRGRGGDNTAFNERVRQPSTMPMDQGSSSAETSITASIRRGIMADEKLSFDAKNVKVLTVGSTVTLRGPVESTQAKMAIAAIAKRTAGVKDVDNQLEVAN
jgi:osmotically-inducible protein OsmY